MSTLLGTGLDKETLATCVSIISNGGNPEGLASAIQYLRQENTLMAANSQVQGQEDVQNQNAAESAVRFGATSAGRIRRSQTSERGQV